MEAEILNFYYLSGFLLASTSLSNQKSGFSGGAVQTADCFM